MSNELYQNIIYMLDKLSTLSMLIKKYPGPNIQKSTFYKIKYNFIESLIKWHEDGENISVKPVCIYKTSHKDIYKFKIRVLDRIIEISCVDTYGWFESRYSTYVNLEKLNLPEMPEQDLCPSYTEHKKVYDEYQDFIHFICNSKFFWIPLSEIHIVYELMKYISKDSNYYVYIDPTVVKTKISWRPVVIIAGFFNEDTNKIIWYRTSSMNIHSIFTDEFIKNNYVSSAQSIDVLYSQIRNRPKYHIYINLDLISSKPYILEHAKAIVTLYNHNRKANNSIPVYSYYKCHKLYDSI